MCDTVFDEYAQAINSLGTYEYVTTQSDNDGMVLYGDGTIVNPYPTILYFADIDCSRPRIIRRSEDRDILGKGRFRNISGEDLKTDFYKRTSTLLDDDVVNIDDEMITAGHRFMYLPINMLNGGEDPINNPQYVFTNDQTGTQTGIQPLFPLENFPSIENGEDFTIDDAINMCMEREPLPYYTTVQGASITVDLYAPGSHACDQLMTKLCERDDNITTRPECACLAAEERRLNAPGTIEPLLLLARCASGLCQGQGYKFRRHRNQRCDYTVCQQLVSTVASSDILNSGLHMTCGNRQTIETGAAVVSAVASAANEVTTTSRDTDLEVINERSHTLLVTVIMSTMVLLGILLFFTAGWTVAWVSPVTPSTTSMNSSETSPEGP